MDFLKKYRSDYSRISQRENFKCTWPSSDIVPTLTPYLSQSDLTKWHQQQTFKDSWNSALFQSAAHRGTTCPAKALSQRFEKENCSCHLADYGPAPLVFSAEFTRCNRETTCADGDLGLSETILLLARSIIAPRPLQQLLMSAEGSAYSTRRCPHAVAGDPRRLPHSSRVCSASAQRLLLAGTTELRLLK